MVRVPEIQGTGIPSDPQGDAMLCHWKDCAKVLLGALLGSPFVLLFADKISAVTWDPHVTPKAEMPQEDMLDCSVCSENRFSVVPENVRPKKVQMTSQPTRRDCMREVLQNCSRQDCSHNDLYQFGVFQGFSMRYVAQNFRKANASFSRMWGFDSFQGLPNEGTNEGDPAVRVDKLGLQAKSTKGLRIKNGDYNNFAKTLWFPGALDMRKVFGSDDFLEIVDKVSKRIGDPRVEFVRGFFNESLTEATFKMLPFRPALYVDIDVDLYSSTVQVLEWLLTSQILVPGTVIYYDDWMSGGVLGNKKAHQESFAKFPGFQVQHLGGKHSWKGCFIVTEVP